MFMVNVCTFTKVTYLPDHRPDCQLTQTNNCGIVLAFVCIGISVFMVNVCTFTKVTYLQDHRPDCQLTQTNDCGIVLALYVLEYQCLW